MLFEGSDIATQQRAEPQSVPAPLGGLNGYNPLAAMSPNDAYVMDNVLPGTSTCKVRAGVQILCPPVGGEVYSLEAYTGNPNNDVLLAYDSLGRVLDVTNGTPNVVYTGLTGHEIVACMFETVADHNQWLINTTGNDVPFYYNGTTCAALAFTGPTGVASVNYANINYVCAYQGRLFWGVKNRLGFAYLPPGQIQGAFGWFDLGQMCDDGGTLTAICTYSADAGNGPSDYIVFITSKGEYLAYQGIDPGDATNWTFVGRYKSAPPIGRKCVMRYADDILVLTLEGALQVSQIRQFGAIGFKQEALSVKLGDILLSHNINANVYGWCMQLYPKGGWLILSVPDSPSETGAYHQFWMNTITKSWGRVLGDEINALCWCVANNNLYYGRYDGSVRQADFGTNDNGSSINYTVKVAYNSFGLEEYKHFKWAIFLLQSEGPVSISSSLSVDFVETVPVPVVSALDPGSGGEWDFSVWDVDSWAGGLYPRKIIQPYGQYGVRASAWLTGSITGTSLEWFSTQYVYEKTTGLLG